MARATQIHTKTLSEIRNVSVDFKGLLDEGELLTGSPTVTELGGSDLTITNAGVNTAAIKINKRTAAVGEAVQFKVAGGVAKKYSIQIQATTNATPQQTLYATIILQVVADNQ